MRDQPDAHAYSYANANPDPYSNTDADADANVLGRLDHPHDLNLPRSAAAPATTDPDVP